jgi:hypothetical protein
MAIQIHIHRFPSCHGDNGCNSACSGMGPERTCAVIEMGPNKAQYCCVHIQPGSEGTTEDVAFLKELVQRGILKVVHVGEPAKPGAATIKAPPGTGFAARNLALKPGAARPQPAAPQPPAGTVGKNAGIFSQLLG